MTVIGAVKKNKMAYYPKEAEDGARDAPEGYSPAGGGAFRSDSGDGVSMGGQGLYVMTGQPIPPRGMPHFGGPRGVQRMGRGGRVPPLLPRRPPQPHPSPTSSMTMIPGGMRGVAPGGGPGQMNTG